MQPLSNAHMKDLAHLGTKKFREREGLVIVEGERCLAQIAAAGVPPREVYLAPGAPMQHPIVTLAEVQYTVQPRQMERLTRAVSPPPIAALFEAHTPPLPQGGHILYLDGIRDPGNLGAILRSAVALGAAGVALSPDCCELFNPKVVQSALGAPFFFPCVTRERDWVQAWQGQVFAADMHGTPANDLPAPAGDALLIIGSEAHGVCDELLARADVRVRIPQPGPMESLNAAVAAGILLYAFLVRT